MDRHDGNVNFNKNYLKRHAGFERCASPPPNKQRLIVESFENRKERITKMHEKESKDVLLNKLYNELKIYQNLYDDFKSQLRMKNNNILKNIDISKNSSKNNEIVNNDDQDSQKNSSIGKSYIDDRFKDYLEHEFYLLKNISKTKRQIHFIENT